MLQKARQSSSSECAVLALQPAPYLEANDLLGVMGRCPLRVACHIWADVALLVCHTVLMVTSD